MKSLKQVLETYKLVITQLPPEDGEGFIARYEELGLSVRGIGDTQLAAMEALEDLALDGLADIAVSELPTATMAAP